MIFSPALAMACLHALSWLLWVTGGLMLILFGRQWLLDGRQVPEITHLLIGAAVFVALGIGSRLLGGAVRRMAERQG
jgi:hypothetical protein